MSLSNLEEKVYFAAMESGPVSFETIKSWELCSNGTLKVVMHNLVKKGYFQRIKKGLYLAKKHGIGIHDALMLAHNLYEGYLSFSTALYIHKLSEDMPFTIFVATKSRSEERIFGNYAIKAVALGKRLAGTEKKEGISVSTIPKTIYDCFRIPQYSGGFANVLKSVYNAQMSQEQWKEFLYYVSEFESYAFCQRIGFMLNLLKKETKLNVPNFILNHMKSKIKCDVYLGKGRYAYAKDWKIMDCIGKEKLLSWWYHG